MRFGRVYVDDIREAGGNLFAIFFGVGIGRDDSGRPRILGYGCSLQQYIAYVNGAMSEPMATIQC